MKKKIYIAGKVTGLDQQEVIDKFADMQRILEGFGFEVVNPIVVVGDWNASWETAMKRCIKALMDCDAIYLMECHSASSGALMELQLAINLEIPYANNILTLSNLWNNSQPTELKAKK